MVIWLGHFDSDRVGSNPGWPYLTARAGCAQKPLVSNLWFLCCRTQIRSKFHLLLQNLVHLLAVKFTLNWSDKLNMQNICQTGRDEERRHLSWCNKVVKFIMGSLRQKPKISSCWVIVIFWFKTLCDDWKSENANPTQNLKMPASLINTKLDFTLWICSEFCIL